MDSEQKVGGSVVIVTIFARPKALHAKRISCKYRLTSGVHRKNGFLDVCDTSYNRALLLTLIDALNRQRTSNIITICTESRYISEGHKHMGDWIKRGWRRSNGQPVRNADLWMRLHELESRHTIRCQLDQLIPYEFDGE